MQCNDQVCRAKSPSQGLDTALHKNIHFIHLTVATCYLDVGINFELTTRTSSKPIMHVKIVAQTPLNHFCFGPAWTNQGRFQLGD